MESDTMFASQFGKRLKYYQKESIFLISKDIHLLVNKTIYNHIENAKFRIIPQAFQGLKLVRSKRHDLCNGTIDSVLNSLPITCRPLLP